MPDATRALDRIAAIEASAAGRPLLPIQQSLMFALRSTSPDLHRAVDDIDLAEGLPPVVRAFCDRALEAEVFAERHPVREVLPGGYLDTLVHARRDLAREVRDITRGLVDVGWPMDEKEQAEVAALRERLDQHAAEEARLRTLAIKLEPGDALRKRILPAMITTDEPARPRDPVRDMFASRERQADFDYPTSAAMRHIRVDIDPEALASRSLANFSNSSALHMNDFAGRVAVYLRTLSPWASLATVVNSDNGRPLVVPQLTGDPTVYTPGEGTAVTPSDATLASVTVTPTGYKALMYVSNEAVEDEQVNLTDVLARAQARAIAIAYGAAFTTAVVAGISNGGTATGLGGGSTATFYGYEDLVDLSMGRAAPYRADGAFVMATTGITKARKWRDAVGGSYLWSQSSSVAGQPSRLDGYPVHESADLAAPGSATKSVVFGDLGAALVVKATPIRVQLSEDFLFDKDQLAIRTTQRIGLAVQDPAAAAYLVSKTA